MVVSIIKETIEVEQITTDGNGNAFYTKKINLEAGKKHRLLQVDMFEDAYVSDFLNIETVITPYPAIPTNMLYQVSTIQTRRYPAGGDNSILFKDRRETTPTGLSDNSAVQFPSREISANNRSEFYTDHVYINMAFRGASSRDYLNIAFSFMLVLDDKSVPILEHSIGILQESHEAMCALTMSNGHMRSLSALRGNVFPMWRYGGIRPEHTISPLSANSFFLQIDTRDAEDMVDTTSIRQAVGDARRMSAFDEAFGERRPDWMTIGLNQGIVAGAVRSDTIPLKYADNGNTRMF